MVVKLFSSIHGWHHTGKKTLAEINNPPPNVSLSRKGMPGPGLSPWSAVCRYLTGHKQCKHQDFQQPGSLWIHAECGMQRDFGNVVCSCNSVICTVKYTHLCIRHGVQTSDYVWEKARSVLFFQNSLSKCTGYDTQH